jgi:hypothetical protein
MLLIVAALAVLSVITVLTSVITGSGAIAWRHRPLGDGFAPIGCGFGWGSSTVPTGCRRRVSGDEAARGRGASSQRWGRVVR